MIRHATIDDVPQLVAMTERFHAANAISVAGEFDPVRTELTWRYALDEPDTSVILVNDEVTAVLWFDLYASPLTMSQNASERLWYAEEGGGLDLLKEATAEAKRRGAHNFSLSRNVEGNPLVERLYRMQGFKPTDVIYAKVL